MQGMDWRWCASLLLVGCFSDPPGASADSTGEGGSSSSTDPGSTSVAGSSSSSSSSDASSTSGESTSTSTTQSLDTSTGRAEACPGDGVCVASPPPEWSGPVIALFAEDGQLDPVCPPTTTEVWAAGRNPAAMCQCDDCSAENVACDVTLGWGANGFCETSSEWLTGCQPFTSDELGQFYLSVELEPAEGAGCSPPEPSAAQFRTRAVACEPQGPSCEGGTCMSGRACVWQEGDVDCPDEFSDKTLLYDGVETETASCDGCDCGENSTLCDSATVSLHGEEMCSDLPVAPPGEYGGGACVPYDEGFVLIQDLAGIDVQPIASDCSSSAGTIAATATFIESKARTLCCVR